MRLVTLSTLFWLIADQASKYGVMYGLNLIETRALDVMPPLLTFRLGFNTGVNFGLFSGGPDVMRWILIVVAILIILWLLWWARHGLTRPIALVSAGAVIGGALGNTFDRLFHGGVIDFLNMSCCGIVNPYVFNVADIGIVGGAIGLVFFADKARTADDAP
ncbi:signal peptidase II [Gymnodinialimonas sp. 2305UL16-5]|uniref:signal peptidase II n=1 Tax=Gymnodinialimonas mytili TaxID=3126503 RepID=UPI003098DDCD